MRVLRLFQATGPKLVASLLIPTLLTISPAHAGDFSFNLGSNPDWPSGANSHSFTLTDQYGFELDVAGTISQSGGTGLGAYPLDEIGIFGTQTSIGIIWDSGAGNSGIGEATSTATLTFSSGGNAIALDNFSFIVSDIDSVDNNSTTDRCDFVTATGDAGNPTLSLVLAQSASTSVQIGPGAGSGATGAIAANQAQCVYNTGTTTSPNSNGDDNGSILVSYPAGTSSATIAYDESIENVQGNTNLDAAARGIGIWSAAAITINQSITLAKSADVPSYPGAGTNITYSYVVTNTGPLPINVGQDIQINDDVIGTFTCPAITSPIPQGGTHTCTASYTTTAADATATGVTNNATAGVGTPGQTFADRLQSSTDTVTIPREMPALSLSKSVGAPTTASGGTPLLTDEGDTIVYSYTVTNTGNVPVNSVSISDAGPTFNAQAANGSLSTFSPASATIPVGGQQVFTATYTFDQADIDNAAGITDAVSNTASASGNSDGGISATSNNSTALATISGGAEITVTKTASNDTNVPAGVTVTYTYVVTNTGNQTVTNISLTDAHNGSGPAPTPNNETLLADNGTPGDSFDSTSTNGVWTSLAPGDAVQFTADYVVTQLDVDNLQ